MQRFTRQRCDGSKRGDGAISHNTGHTKGEMNDGNHNYRNEKGKRGMDAC